MVVQILDIPMALVAMCQHRPSLQQDHGPRHGPRQQPRTGKTWSGGNQVTNISPLVTTFSSSDLCLTLSHIPSSLSLSLTIYLFIRMDPPIWCLPGWVGLWMPLGRHDSENPVFSVSIFHLLELHLFVVFYAPVILLFFPLILYVLL